MLAFRIFNFRKPMWQLIFWEPAIMHSKGKLFFIFRKLSHSVFILTKLICDMNFNRMSGWVLLYRMKRLIPWNEKIISLEYIRVHKCNYISKLSFIYEKISMPADWIKKKTLRKIFLLLIYEKISMSADWIKKPT